MGQTGEIPWALIKNLKATRKRKEVMTEILIAALQHETRAFRG